MTILEPWLSKLNHRSDKELDQITTNLRITKVATDLDHITTNTDKF
jgi:hypothetical protein